MRLQEVRVEHFRALRDAWVPLRPTTVLIGENNSGKTTLLHALAALFGARRPAPEDIYLAPEEAELPRDRVLRVDGLVVPEAGSEFDQEVADLLGEAVQVGEGASAPDFVALRAELAWDESHDDYRFSRRFLRGWAPTAAEAARVVAPLTRPGLAGEVAELFSFQLLDARRDVTEQLRMRGSFWARLVRDPRLPAAVVQEIERAIDGLNARIVTESEVFAHVSETLATLDISQTVPEGGVRIVPIPSRLSDLAAGMDITYAAPGAHAFPLEQHGMGTRSWSALLVFEAYVRWLREHGPRTGRRALHMIGVEEPEAHLHPQAQRSVFQRLAASPGQQFVSTHSPSVAAGADIDDMVLFRARHGQVIIRPMAADKGFSRDLRLEVQRYIQLGHPETLFARLLLLVSGDTEEIALPMFAKAHSGRTLDDQGVALVNVRSDGAFAPFIRAAVAAGILWHILSDAEPSARGQVDGQLKRCGLDPAAYAGSVTWLPDETNWESYMVGEYPEEVEAYIDAEREVGFVARQSAGRSRAAVMANFLKNAKPGYAVPLTERILALEDPRNRVPERVAALFTNITASLAGER